MSASGTERTLYRNTDFARSLQRKVVLCLSNVLLLFYGNRLFSLSLNNIHPVVEGIIH